MVRTPCVACLILLVAFVPLHELGHVVIYRSNEVPISHVVWLGPGVLVQPDYSGVNRAEVIYLTEKQNDTWEWISVLTFFLAFTALLISCLTDSGATGSL